MPGACVPATLGWCIKRAVYDRPAPLRPNRTWFAGSAVAVALGCRRAAAGTLMACGDDAELLVRIDVVGGAAASADGLEVAVFGSKEVRPLVTRSIAIPDGLPQTLLVVIGSGTRGEHVRLHVEALAFGQIVAAGDRVLRLPDGGRSETTVTLEEDCAGVRCDGLQACVAADHTCDGSCADDGACTRLLGCAASSVCVKNAGSAIGHCQGMGADADMDGRPDGRCPLEESRDDPDRADCDDTLAASSPGEAARCGGARDHDCDGRVDEAQLCASACGPGSISIAAEQAAQLDTGATITALGAIRSEVDGTLIVAGGEDAVRTYYVTDLAGTPRLISAVTVGEVHQLYLIGPELYAATDDGLEILALDREGQLTRLGDPIVVNRATPALTAVVVAEDTAWVSGPGAGLAAFDVGHVETPRLLGVAAGPAATSLHRIAGGVLAIPATASGANLLSYGAPPRGAPGPAVDLSDVLGLDERLVTAVTASPGRSGAGEQEIIAIAATDGAAGEIHLFERLGSSVFEPRGGISGLSLIAGLHLDAGTLLYATASGATGAIVRGADPGALSEVSANEPRGAERDLRTFWATADTTSDQPVAAVGLGSVVRVVRFTCR